MVCLGVLLVLGLSPAALHATVLTDWSLEDLAGRSDMVCVGTIKSEHTHRLHSPRRVLPELVREVHVVVEQCLKFSTPAPPTTLRLFQLGGEDGERSVEIIGDAKLRLHQRYLLFTALDGRTGRRHLVGMGLGALLWPQHTDDPIQVVHVPLMNAEGQLRIAPSRSVSLAQVQHAIERSRMHATEQAYGGSEQ